MDTEARRGGRKDVRMLLPQPCWRICKQRARRLMGHRIDRGIGLLVRSYVHRISVHQSRKAPLEHTQLQVGR